LTGAPRGESAAGPREGAKRARVMGMPAAAGPMESAVVIALAEPGALPSERLAGLSLGLRAVLALQRAGLRRIVVLTALDEPLRAELDSDPRVDPCVRVAVVHELSDALMRLAEVGETALVLPAHALVSPARIQGLREDDAQPWALRGSADGGLFAARPEGLAALASLEGTLEARLERARDEAGFQLEAPRGWQHLALDPEGKRRAFDQLFEDCRKPVDGIVSRHLNRHVSLFVSRRIVGLPFTPNQISGLTFLFGIAAALLTAQGGYWSFLGGALLFQLNSILDGVDGEIARVRFEFSRLGEWIDTVCDDLSNALFYGGLAFAASRMPAPFPTLALFGWGGVALGVVTMFLYYSELLRRGSGDFYALGVGSQTEPSGPLAPIIKAISYAAKKDFFILGFVVAAAFGVLPYALPVIFAGTVATTFTGISLHIRRFRARDQGVQP